MGTTRKHASTRLGSLIGLLALALTTLLGTSLAAAEPPYQTEGTITSVDFASESVQTGSNARIDAAWSLPDNAEPPAGFVIDLPEELQGRTDGFPLTDGDGAVMGRCTVTATQVYCDLDADYLAQNPRDVGGALNFWVKVTTEVTETTEVTYDFDEVSASITVTPGPGACTENCDFTGRSNYKWGSYQTDGDWIAWGVSVKAPATGMTAGQNVTVVDRPGPGLEITRAYLVRTNQVVTNADGKQVLRGWREVPAGGFTVSDDMTTVSFVADEGYFYEVRYDTATTDEGGSAEYTNEADVTIDGQRTVTVRRTVESQGGGGTGSGTNVGTFTITKEVTGAVEAAAGVTFSGTYAVTTPAGETLEGTFEVADGDTWTSDEFPRGSTVHLTEVAPVTPETVTWAEPEFSDNDFTLGGGTTVAVTLTNDATLRTGAFAVSKVVAGDGAAQVPADATFVVAYSYPAGAGYAAGSGELIVSADGTAVTSPALPVGAEVRLTEVAPDPVEGVTWGEPQFSPATLTIGADETAQVVLTNTATPTEPTTEPSEPTEPTTEPSEPGPTPTAISPATATRTLAPTDSGSSSGSAQPALPSTGADISGSALGAALVLMAAGACLLLVRRRRALR